MASATSLREAVEPQPKNRRNVKYASTCAILASMVSVMFGYDIGVMSGVSLYIKKDLKITDVQLEILMGVLNLYSLIGSFAAGRTSDWIGRRYTVVLTASIFFAGALLMGFAVNYAMLMAGQLVAGVGAGYALMIAPVYTAEISPASARGFLTSFPELLINLGILLGYVSNYAFARLPLRLGWRVMFGVGAALSALIAVAALGVPESPRWLVMKGRLADAKVVLVKTSDTPEEAAARLADIKEAAGIPEDLAGDVVTVPKKHSSGEMQLWKELVFSPTPAMRWILLAALGLNFFQQATGVHAVVLYSPRVFQSAGITDESRLLGTTCAVGVTKLLSTLVATFLLDRAGRRPLLLSSTAGMVVSLAALGTGLAVVGHRPDAKVPWAIALCITSILAYVSVYSVGLGPIVAVYTAEIFPLRVRALGFALGLVCNRSIAAVVSMSFLSLSKAITIGNIFFLYAGMAALAWVFVFTYLPETRGRTLEEMGRQFGMTDAGTEAQDAAVKDEAAEIEVPTN
ncbi:hypothetical protein ACP70R_042436 [Stipagrostis hirtigluma subsp. patula]